MPGPRAQAPFPRASSVLLAATALAALAARAAVVAATSGHPLLQPDVGLDTGTYVALARRVAAGDLFLRSVPEPFFVSPLYVWFAGAVLAVSRGSLLAVLSVQALLGAAACWLAGDSARRLFGAWAGAPAAALLGLAGVVAFHESVLLQAALDPFLAALALWLLVRALEGDGGAARFLAAGLALGLFALNRPNVLPWAAVAGFLVLLRRGRRPDGRAAGASAALLVGALLGVAPATLRNVLVSGEAVLVSSHGGLNFLVGNGPGAEGVYRALEGITPSIEGQAADARRVAEQEAGRALSAREVSARFAAKAWGWIASEPGAALRLFLHKVRLVLSSDEAPLNFSFPWYRGRIPALRLLPVGPGLLVPLGGAGIALLLAGAGRMKPRDAAPWASFAPVYVLLVAAFFVATRYRLPLYVPLATAAGGAAAVLVESLRRRETGRVVRFLALAAAVALPLAAVSLAPTGLYDGAADEEMHWILHLAGTGSQADAAEARSRAEAAAPAHPDPALFWKRVAAAWGGAGMADDEIQALGNSLAVERDPKAEALLAARLEKRGVGKVVAGDVSGALPDLEAAVRLDPRSAAARLNLAAVLAERGDRARARSLAREALDLEPGYAKAEALLRALGPD